VAIERQGEGGDKKNTSCISTFNIIKRGCVMKFLTIQIVGTANKLDETIN